MIPILLFVSTFMIMIIGSVDKQLQFHYPFLRIVGLILIIIWILIRQCKVIYFDNEFLYINSLLKKKPIRQIKHKEIKKISGAIGLFFVKIVYTQNNKEKRVFTLVDMKTTFDEMGLSSWPGLELLYGKPMNKLTILRELIKSQGN